MKIVVLAVAAFFLTQCSSSEFTSGRSPTKPPANESDSIERVEISQKVEPIVIEKTFAANRLASMNGSVDLANRVHTTELTLKNNYSGRSLTQKQINRPFVVDMHEQGASGMAYVEMFDQASFNGVVDVLVIVDNSSSMRQEQKNLSTKLNPLLEHIKNVDWQIAFTTTSISSDCRPSHLIRRGDANAATAFAAGAQPGTSGSGNERGIKAAMDALNCNTLQWVRANSTLAVLIVTDEDNCSNGSSSCPNENPDQFISFLSNTLGRKPGVDARFYGIHWVPGTSCSDAGSRANDYHDLVVRTKGTEGSVCDADYSVTLKAISLDIASTLKTQFNLKARPDNNQISVKVNSNPWPDYTLAEKVVTFTKVPPTNAKIEIGYVTGRGEMKKEFALSKPPADGTASVVVNGQMANPGDYTIDKMNGKVIFPAEPTPDATIKVSYRLDAALVKEFDINPTAVKDTVKVKVNDQESNDFTHDAAAGKVIMGNAPPDDADVVIQYKNNDGAVLDYQVSLAGSEIRDLKAYDKNSSSPVGIAYAAGVLSVTPGDHQENRMIKVQYKNEDSNKNQILLPFEPIPESLSLSGIDGNCSLATGGIVIDGPRVLIDCEVDPNALVTINYQYVREVQSFTFDKPDGGGLLEVFIDDQPFSDFVVEGSIVRINSELQEGAIVRIRYTLNFD